VVRAIRVALEAAFAVEGTFPHPIHETVGNVGSDMMGICWNAPGLFMTLHWDELGNPVVVDRMATT
jgi:hypothetical protein